MQAWPVHEQGEAAVVCSSDEIPEPTADDLCPACRALVPYPLRVVVLVGDA